MNNSAIIKFENKKAATAVAEVFNTSIEECTKKCTRCFGGWGGSLRSDDTPCECQGQALPAWGIKVPRDWSRRSFKKACTAVLQAKPAYWQVRDIDGSIPTFMLESWLKGSQYGETVKSSDSKEEALEIQEDWEDYDFRWKPVIYPVYDLPLLPPLPASLAQSHKDGGREVPVMHWRAKRFFEGILSKVTPAG